LEGLGLKSREKVVGEIRTLPRDNKIKRWSQKFLPKAKPSFSFEKIAEKEPLAGLYQTRYLENPRDGGEILH
jgi:hypothetical protein